MKAVDIEQRQCNRLKLLHIIAVESSSLDVRAKELAYGAGLKNGKFEEAFKYLVNEKLLIESQFQYQVRLSHEGVKLIEWAILNPSKKQDVYAFPPLDEIEK